MKTKYFQMVIFSCVLLMFIILSIDISAEEKGLFFNKPKPDTEIVDLVEEVLNATDKTYKLYKETEIKTNKGFVKFSSDYYIVSQDYIIEHTKNQNDLILSLNKISNLKFINEKLKIASITCSILTLSFFIMIVLLSRKRG
jgi:hypothetical protein